LIYFNLHLAPAPLARCGLLSFSGPTTETVAVIAANT
jgi:hypothetical protein